MREDYFAMKSSRHMACIKIHLLAIDLLFIDRLLQLTVERINALFTYLVPKTPYNPRKLYREFIWRNYMIK